MAENASQAKYMHKKTGIQTASARQRKRRDNMIFLTMALPGILCFLLFHYMPLFGITIAFKNYNPVKGIMGSQWVGFRNFQLLFRSTELYRLMRNTVGYSLLFLVLNMLGNFFVALFLYYLKSRISVKIYNTIMILPRFMSMVLIAYVVYVILNPASGLLNKVGAFFGSQRVDWYAKANAWPFILSVVEVWKTVGYGCIIYYAAMMGIDESLFEAAKLDGANRYHQTVHVVLPSLTMIISIQLILSIGGLFSGDMGLFYQVPMNIKSLYSTTDIINTYVYRGTLEGRYSLASAVGLFQNVVGLMLVILSNAIVRKISPENSLF